MNRVRRCHYSTSLTPVYPIIMSSTGTCTTFVNFPYEVQHNSSLTGTFGRLLADEILDCSSFTKILKATPLKQQSQQVDKADHEIDYNVKKRKEVAKATICT